MKLGGIVYVEFSSLPARCRVRWMSGGGDNTPPALLDQAAPVRLLCVVDTVAKHSNRGGGGFRGSPDRAFEGAGLPSNRRASRTLAPAGDESQPYRRSPWRRPNDRNQSPTLDQVALTRNVKADSVRQQWPFPHPVVPVIPVFRGRLHLGQAQENGKIHQSAPGVA